MQAAIDEGATIINDISALSDDKAADVISKNNVRTDYDAYARTAN